MQRKMPMKGNPDFAREPELMPFQKKYPEVSRNLYTPNKMQMALMSLPIFGGEPESDPTEKPESTSEPSKKSTDPSGGDLKTEITPEQFAQLTTQVAQLTEKNTELSTTLQSYQSKEDEARKASMGREESLSEDLTKAQETIDRMDQVIKRLAVVNAIQGNKDLQFHNVDDAIARLAPDSYELEVDLEAGSAKVSGIEAELSRIAKENEYLVVKPNLENNEQPTRQTRRSTGNPPGPQPTSPSKANRRKELEAKWPVIASGRAALG